MTVFKIDNKQRKILRKNLEARLSLTELKLLCFDLGIEFENFSNNKSILIVDLLRTLLMKDRLNELVEWLKEEDLFFEEIENVFLFESKKYESTLIKRSSNDGFEEKYLFLIWRLNQLEEMLIDLNSTKA